MYNKTEKNCSRKENPQQRIVTWRLKKVVIETHGKKEASEKCLLTLQIKQN